MELTRMLVKQIMRAPAITIAPTTSVHATAALMDKFAIGVLPVIQDGRPVGVITDRQIRRLVVVGAQGAVDGVVSLDDVANDASEELAGQTLGEIVEQR